MKSITPITIFALLIISISKCASSNINVTSEDVVQALQDYIHASNVKPAIYEEPNSIIEQGLKHSINPSNITATQEIKQALQTYLNFKLHRSIKNQSIAAVNQDLDNGADPDCVEFLTWDLNTPLENALKLKPKDEGEKNIQKDIIELLLIKRANPLPISPAEARKKWLSNIPFSKRDAETGLVRNLFSMPEIVNNPELASFLIHKARLHIKTEDREKFLTMWFPVEQERSWFFTHPGPRESCQTLASYLESLKNPYMLGNVMLVSTDAQLKLLPRALTSLFKNLKKNEPNTNNVLLNTIELLRNFKVNVNVTNKKGDTPLIEAVQRKHDSKIIQSLLNAGADPNIYKAHTKFYRTVLQEAIFQKYPITTIQSLLEARANPNNTDDQGFTALMNAADLYDNFATKEEKAYSLEIIKLLLQYQANPLLTNHQNQKASDLARNENAKETLLKAELEAEQKFFIAAYNRTLPKETRLNSSVTDLLLKLM